jgi:hypothetical protein
LVVLLLGVVLLLLLLLLVVLLLGVVLLLLLLLLVVGEFGQGRAEGRARGEALAAAGSRGGGWRGDEGGHLRVAAGGGGVARRGEAAGEVAWEAALRLGVGVSAGGGDSWVRRAVGFVRRHIQREWHYSRPPRHLDLTKLPVHGLGGSPGDLHLFGDFGPHFGFEPGKGG